MSYAAAGSDRKIAIVPQGRRRFVSLTVIEHLTMLKKRVRQRRLDRRARVRDFTQLAEAAGIIVAHNCLAASAACWRAAALMIDLQLFLMDGPSEGSRADHGEASRRDHSSLKRRGCRSCRSNNISAVRLAVAIGSTWRPAGVHPANVGELAQHTGGLFTRLGVH